MKRVDDATDQAEKQWCSKGAMGLTYGGVSSWGQIGAEGCPNEKGKNGPIEGSSQP